MIDNTKITFSLPTIFNQNVQINSTLTVSGNTTITNGYCKAVYFDTTSDIRAKKDIQAIDINALDIINNINVKSFTYKDTDTKSIGIIAQEIQNLDIAGFKFVDNEEASGHDMDYMSIHEGKLVYLLWKAIQEQQKEIKELKAQLEK